MWFSFWEKLLWRFEVHGRWIYYSILRRSLKNTHLTCCGKVGSISKSKRMISGSNISRNQKSNEKLDDLWLKIRCWSQRNLKCLRVRKTNTSFRCCEKIYVVMNKAYEWTKVQQSSLLCSNQSLTSDLIVALMLILLHWSLMFHTKMESSWILVWHFKTKSAINYYIVENLFT